MANLTPLRYPGGKARLRPYLEELINLNGLTGGDYIEPFCGGAGLALELLFAAAVETIHINDLDRAVFSFWESAVKYTDDLCERIYVTPCDMDTWHKQRKIWNDKQNASILDLGFATFFLNRTNRSGILGAGVIGGKNQTGDWKIDARYNREELIERIKKIGGRRSQILVSNEEANIFLRSLPRRVSKRSFIYLDPPYVEKGPGLYLNYYLENDHRELSKFVRRELSFPWMVSYDDHPLIRECYGSQNEIEMSFPYSAYGNARRGTELVYFSKNLLLPDMKDRRYRYKKPWDVKR